MTKNTAQTNKSTVKLRIISAQKLETEIPIFILDHQESHYEKQRIGKTNLHELCNIFKN